MIYLIQGGRCGNQFFSYAFLKKLAKEYPCESIVVLLDAVQGMNNDNNGSYWEDCLQRFKTIDYRQCFEKGNIVLKRGSFVQKIAYFLWRVVWEIDKKSNNKLDLQKIIFPLISKNGLYFYTGGKKLKVQYSKQKDKFIFGCFENKMWFDDIRDELLIELVSKKYYEPDALSEIINSTNSVCVSIRKWDIDVHSNKALLSRSICDRDYFKKAINEIIKRVDNPYFIVFSDDVEWAKKVISEVCKEYPVLAESGNDSIDRKMELMSSCKHFIISNSTFSWWAQYLSKNNDKVVISPDRWFFDNKKGMQLIEKKWIKIDCGKNT